MEEALVGTNCTIAVIRERGEKGRRNRGREDERPKPRMGGKRWSRSEIGGASGVRGHARTHVNLSAASRCYRGTTLMSCVLSVLLRAPRQCIWPIVHLSIHVALRSFPLASPRAPIIPPFTSLVNRPIIEWNH